MTILTTRRIIFIVLVVLVVPVLWELLSRFSQLTVSFVALAVCECFANVSLDQKQARDLVSVLSEAKQQIDPRLAEMARFGGGGGGRYGGGGYRGGRGGGRGGGKLNQTPFPVPSADGTNKGRW